MRPTRTAAIGFSNGMSETQRAAEAPLMERMSGSISPSAERRMLMIVEVVLREEGAQRTIGHARGEDLLLARTALALEVSAGELADGGGLLLVIDGEREEILAFLYGSGGNGADEDDGLAGADDDGSVGELGDLAGLKADGILADLGRDGGV
jgi:hypothetical protein